MSNTNNPSEEKIKILIVRLSAIGDVVHSLPILHAIKSKYPNATIGWLVEDKATDLIINNPLIDNVHILPKARWKKQKSLANIKEFFALIKELRKEKYDIAIDLQELFKSGLMTFLSGSPRRIAHAKTREFADLFVNEKLKAHDIFDTERMIVDRYLEPARYLGASTDEVKFSLPPVPTEDKQHVDNLLSEINKPIAILCPSTIWKTKHWIDEYWAVLLDELQNNFDVIFIGAPSDKQLVEKIVSHSKTKNYTSLIGKTSLLQLIEVFNRSEIMVAPDTGPAHIADATGKPIIFTIFGSTAKNRSKPYGDKHKAFAADIACQPCFKRNCLRKDFNMECVKLITPEIILDAIKDKFTYPL